ncbi:MAG: hypothetical protein KGS72_17120 [Cyanobacteria bacterium REEB67]|nr:hypothetical protein [Cyanobacteria bacterium REEB67]
MSATKYLLLKDIGLSVKSEFLDLFGRKTARRVVLGKLLELRAQRYAAGHPQIAAVKEALALSYLTWTMAELEQADALALDAIASLKAVNVKGRYEFRIANMLQLRSRVAQRFYRPRVALELAEDALASYNRSRMISWQRARLMESLIQLHRVVGDPERARRLVSELQVLRTVLNSRSARHRYL